MYSLHDWEYFSIPTDGKFLTTKHAHGIGVNAHNIETMAQIGKKQHWGTCQGNNTFWKGSLDTFWSSFWIYNIKLTFVLDECL